mgnify:CR=1 FL=1
MRQAEKKRGRKQEARESKTRERKQQGTEKTEQGKLTSMT